MAMDAGRSGPFSYDPQRDSLRRDKLRAELRGLLLRHRDKGRAAGDRISKRIRGFIAEKNADKRKGVEEKLKLLPLAREIVLDRAAMEADSAWRVDPSDPPAGFEVIGWAAANPVPVWMKRAYEAVGRWDQGINTTLWTLAGHLGNATRGRIGDYAVPYRIKLSETSAESAYIFAISHLWAMGKQTPEQVRAELDPDRVLNACATPWFALAEMLEDIIYAAPDLRRTESEWWDVAALYVAADDPSFEPSSIGLGPCPPWSAEADQNGFPNDRHGLLDYCVGYEEHGLEARNRSLGRLVRQVERAAEHLRQILPATPAEPESGAPTPDGRQVAALASGDPPPAPSKHPAEALADLFSAVWRACASLTGASQSYKGAEKAGAREIALERFEILRQAQADAMKAIDRALHAIEEVDPTLKPIQGPRPIELAAAAKRALLPLRSIIGLSLGVPSDAVEFAKYLELCGVLSNTQSELRLMLFARVNGRKAGTIWFDEAGALNVQAPVSGDQLLEGLRKELLRLGRYLRNVGDNDGAAVHRDHIMQLALLGATWTWQFNFDPPAMPPEGVVKVDTTPAHNLKPLAGVLNRIGLGAGDLTAEKCDALGETLTGYIGQHTATAAHGPGDGIIKGGDGGDVHQAGNAAVVMGAEPNQGQSSPLPGPTNEGLNDQAPLGATELAAMFGLEPEAVRKRLERWRLKNVESEEYVEVANRRSQEPQYLYRIRLARGVLKGLPSSGTASGTRPPD